LPTPVPTQIVSNGEFTPPPQTPDQRRVEAGIERYAEQLGPRHGLTRRQFLASNAGMAAAFIAMNDVFGPLFNVSTAEAAVPGVADARAGTLSSQFIFDVQTHCVREDYAQKGLLGLAQFAKAHWNPALANESELTRFMFANYLKEIFVDSDTKVALLSGAPVDDPFNLFLTNDQIAAARASVNTIAGSRRMLAHSIIQPMTPGYLDEVDRAIETLHPDSWKGYTIGDPIFLTKKGSNWRLDDEKLVYPFYEKAVKSGIKTICIHKGLMPGRLRDVVGRALAIRNRVGSRQGGEGLAAAHVRDLSLGAAAVHGAARPEPGRVREDRSHRLGDRPRGDTGETWRHERLRRARHVLREYGGHPSAARRRDARHAGQGPRQRQGAVGHRLRLVRLAAVADRGLAAPRDSGGPAAQAWLRATRRCPGRGQERDLRGQRRAHVRHRHGDEAQRDP
jgi:hypothetical protein